MPDSDVYVPAIAGGDEADTRMAMQVARETPMFFELGATGLKRAGGYLDEEFLPALKGKKAIQVYREMGDNNAMCGALLHTLTQLLRNLDWTVKPAGKNKDAANAAKLVETCQEDMSSSWDDMICEILTCVQYGWSWHEIVYKRRRGPWQRDGKQRSKYSDDLIGWRKIPIRAQETLLRWIFDPDGGIQGMIQIPPPTYQTITLPIQRSLLFRFGVHKGNPEGYSILRRAYRSWFMLKRLEEFEAIGVERDLVGLPKITLPANFLKAKPGTEQYKQVQQMIKLVRSIRRNEQEGIVFPSDFDEETKQQLYNFELVTSGGARQFPTDPIIQRYRQEILMTALADFILVGHQDTGTYNMHLDKTSIFKATLNATAQMIADVFNRHAIPRLFAVNGWRPAELPTIVPGDVDAPDLTQLSQFLTATAGLGMNWLPDAEMERWLRQVAGMPELDDTGFKTEQRIARQEEAIRVADTEARYLASRSQLAQLMASQRMTAEGQPSPEDAQNQATQGAQLAQMQAQQEAARQNPGAPSGNRSSSGNARGSSGNTKARAASNGRGR